MIAELKEIFYIIQDFCMEHYILILMCTNTLALLLAIICLFRTSRKREKQQSDDFGEEVKLNLSIERAEVKISQVSAVAGEKISENPPKSQEIADIDAAVDTAGPAQTDDTTEKETKTIPEEKPVIIEKLLPIGSRKLEPGEYYTSRSGKIYSKEDVLRQIKD